MSALADTIREAEADTEAEDDGLFCDEPWTGIFSVQSDGTVRCCPCYAQVVLGNINESTIEEIWNAEPLIEMRAAFSSGVAPVACKGQLCPVMTGAG